MSDVETVVPVAGEPQLLGPEIPQADVNELGVFRFSTGESETYDQMRIEFSTAPLFAEDLPIEWLWPGRIPLGMVTFLEGAGSSGKSLVVLDMAARVTRGKPWPGGGPGEQRPADVLMFCGDPDSWERIILPRLLHAGADIPRVGRCLLVDSRDGAVMERGKEWTKRPIRFPHDLTILEHNIRLRPETRLVVIDPLSAYCTNDHDFRETLRQLEEVAARRNVAIVVTSRPKGAAARRWRPHEADRRADTVRSVFRVLVDPADPKLHYLAPVRTTFCAEPEWLPFQIGPKHVVGGGMIAWGPPAEVPPETAAPPHPATERGAIRRMVSEWLRDMLLKSDMPYQRVLHEAKQCGFSAATLRRAREGLKVRMFRDQGGPFSSGWWTLRPEGWKGGPVPDGCPYDAVMLAEIQNWEPDESQFEKEEETGTPERESPADAPDVRRRSPEVSPGMGSGRPAARRARPPQSAPVPEAIESDAEESFSPAEWDDLRGPLLAAVLASAREEAAPSRAGEAMVNGHSPANCAVGEEGR